MLLYQDHLHRYCTI